MCLVLAGATGRVGVCATDTRHLFVVQESEQQEPTIHYADIGAKLLRAGRGWVAATGEGFLTRAAWRALAHADAADVSDVRRRIADVYAASAPAILSGMPAAAAHLERHAFVLVRPTNAATEAYRFDAAGRQVGDGGEGELLLTLPPGIAPDGPVADELRRRAHVAFGATSLADFVRGVAAVFALAAESSPAVSPIIEIGLTVGDEAFRCIGLAGALAAPGASVPLAPAGEGLIYLPGSDSGVAMVNRIDDHIRNAYTKGESAA